MNLKTFFTTEYLFNVNSAFISPRQKLFFFAGLVLVLLSIVMKIAGMLAPSSVDEKYRLKFYNLFLTIGLAELLWYACRYENIRFFDTQFMAWLIVLVGLIWLVKIVVSVFKNYKKEKLVWEKEQVRQKYLPK